MAFRRQPIIKVLSIQTTWSLTLIRLALRPQGPHPRLTLPSRRPFHLTLLQPSMGAHNPRQPAHLLVPCPFLRSRQPLFCPHDLVIPPSQLVASLLAPGTRPVWLSLLAPKRLSTCTRVILTILRYFPAPTRRYKVPRAHTWTRTAHMVCGVHVYLLRCYSIAEATHQMTRLPPRGLLHRLPVPRDIVQMVNPFPLLSRPRTLAARVKLLARARPCQGLRHLFSCRSLSAAPSRTATSRTSKRTV